MKNVMIWIWAHNTVYRSCIIKLYTWNLYYVVNQCYSSKLNLKKWVPTTRQTLGLQLYTRQQWPSPHQLADYGRKWTSFTEVKQFAGIHTANTGQREAMDSNLKPMLFTKTLIISTQLKNKFYNADKLWNCMNLYSISSRNKNQSYLNVLIIYNFYK